jgi:hypothetical protein
MLDTNMKTHRNLGLAALVVFIISFFLPAFGGMSGFASFAFCWNTLLGHDPTGFMGNVRILSGAWFYYSGFVMSNILFLGLVAALFLPGTIGRLGSVFSLVCFLQALSWLVLFTISGDPSKIKVGYYVWLIAYGLLVAAYPWKRMSNQCAAANPRRAMPLHGSDNLSAFVAADPAFPAAVR